MSTVLVTGAAGFIGFHLAKALLAKGYDVVGLDNLNDYYDVDLKYGRLGELGIDRNSIQKELVVSSNNFTFYFGDLVDDGLLDKIFSKHKFEYIVHLAAQAGVRYSLDHPLEYIASNVMGFTKLLERVRKYPVKHFLYASSSSVYGLDKVPYDESKPADHPVSIYAATKRSDELIAHAYSYLFDIPTTGLRFFTVYGPWGRPDMAVYKFAEKIMNDEVIDVYNNGEMLRDFTYIDDVVEAITLLLDKMPEKDEKWSVSDPNPSTSVCRYRILNIGNDSPVLLGDFIDLLEESLGKVAKKQYLPIQPGDVKDTHAKVEALYSLIDFRPKTNLKQGLNRFVEWFTMYNEGK